MAHVAFVEKGREYRALDERRIERASRIGDARETRETDKTCKPNGAINGSLSVILTVNVRYVSALTEKFFAKAARFSGGGGGRGRACYREHAQVFRGRKISKRKQLGQLLVISL